VNKPNRRTDMGLLDAGTCPSSQGFFYLIGHLVKFRYGTSLPLVTFTRFLLLAPSFFIHARGLFYFTNYHIHGYGLLVSYIYTVAMLMLARRVFIG
jgi:hypothetical protein